MPEYPWAFYEPGLDHPIVLQTRRTSEFLLTVEQARRLVLDLQMAIDNAEEASGLARSREHRKPEPFAGCPECSQDGEADE